MQILSEYLTLPKICKYHVLRVNYGIALYLFYPFNPLHHCEFIFFILTSTCDYFCADAKRLTPFY